MLCILCIFADATHMGCAEAKVCVVTVTLKKPVMQPTWDALRQRCLRVTYYYLLRMQPTWDALRQSIRYPSDLMQSSDATHMGCAEAKDMIHCWLFRPPTMQPAWDALRQRHSATVTAAGADDATRMGCAEAKSHGSLTIIPPLGCNPHGMR